MTQFLNLFNPFGLAFAVLLALPYLIYHRKRRFKQSDFPNKGMYLFDRMGRLGAVLLMSVHIGVLEKGFTEPKALMERFWIISTAALVLLSWLLWVFFFRNERRLTANLIVIAGAAAVILSGILQVNTLLLTFGIVFPVGELYIVRCVIPK